MAQDHVVIIVQLILRREVSLLPWKCLHKQRMGYMCYPCRQEDYSFRIIFRHMSESIILSTHKHKEPFVVLKWFHGKHH